MRFCQKQPLNHSVREAKSGAAKKLYSFSGFKIQALSPRLLIEIKYFRIYNGAMLTCFIAASVFALIVFLLNFCTKRKSVESGYAGLKARKIRSENAQKKGLLVSCPVCGSFLLPGEDLKSRVYRPMNVPDQLCTINGCPHCYPKVEPGLKRSCPVCHKKIPVSDGHLVARLFNKSDGKKHVIVTGCSLCCRGKK